MRQVLFLCTGNSARSILAEAYLNCAGKGAFRAYSAGSRPVGRVNPLALELLEKSGLPTGGLRSKSWEEFRQVRLDFVITVCDAAAAEQCPVWPGKPLTEHWSIADPAAARGTDAERRNAFAVAFGDLKGRIDRFIASAAALMDPERHRAEQRAE